MVPVDKIQNLTLWEGYPLDKEMASHRNIVCLEVPILAGLAGNEGMNPQYTNVKVDSLIPY